MTALRAIAPPPPCASAVKLLEEWLERAKAGELSSVALAGVDRDGVGLTAWTGARKMTVTTLLGAVTRLQHRLIAGDRA